MQTVTTDRKVTQYTSEVGSLRARAETMRANVNKKGRVRQQGKLRRTEKHLAKYEGKLSDRTGKVQGRVDKSTAKTTARDTKATAKTTARDTKATGHLAAKAAREVQKGNKVAQPAKAVKASKLKKGRATIMPLPRGDFIPAGA